MRIPERLNLKLRNYVYFLRDEHTREIFYVGRGFGDRILHHSNEAKSGKLESNKISKIKKIWSEGGEIGYYILRSGLNEETAVEVEAAAIDLLLFKNIKLSNQQRGSGSDQFGLSSLLELIYQHEENILENIPKGFVAININKKYQRWSKAEEVYEMVRQSWVIDRRRIGSLEAPKLKYVLAEVRGLIVAVFEVSNWYQVEASGRRKRWAFRGRLADPRVANLYLHRTLKKKQGAAFPLTYHRENCIASGRALE